MAESAFLDWLRGEGAFIHDSLDIFSPQPGGDRSVVAKRDIAAGTDLVKIPERCTLFMPVDPEDLEAGRNMASRLEGVRYLTEHHADLTPFTAMVLAVLAEMARGSSSPLAHFLSTWPHTVNSPLIWPDGDRRVLRELSVELESEQQLQGFDQEATAVMAARPDLWPHPSSSKACLRRVAALVQSRTFHMVRENWLTGESSEGTALYLLPGIDMLNHSSLRERRSTSLSRKALQPAAGSREAARKRPQRSGGSGSSGRVQVDEWFFVMTAERDIACGEQVLHSYGELSDGQLLQTYGFVEADLPSGNPHNFVLLRWPDVKVEALWNCAPCCLPGPLALCEIAEQVRRRERLLLRGGLLPRGLPPRRCAFQLTAAHPLPRPLRIALCVLTMPAGALAVVERDVEERERVGEGDAFDHPRWQEENGELQPREWELVLQLLTNWSFPVMPQNLQNSERGEAGRTAAAERRHAIRQVLQGQKAILDSVLLKVMRIGAHFMLPSEQEAGGGEGAGGAGKRRAQGRGGCECC